MIVAIPVWQGRVSPVFDVAGNVLLVEMDRSVEKSRREELLAEQTLDRRAEYLPEQGVDTLICGAISRALESLLTARGVLVIPRICGSIDDVLGAFRNGTLNDERFAMPGCCGRRRRGRQRCRSRRR